MPNTKLLRSRVMGNYQARFWSRVGRGDLSCLGNYNRRLKRLVAVELKTGKFKAEYVGQMQLYLGWLKQFEVLEDENPPIGIILCTEKSSHQIELLEIDKSSIHVAEYWTELPPPDVFERKIREIVNRSKERMAIFQAGNPKESNF